MDPSLKQVRQWTSVADVLAWVELGQDLSETGAAGSLLRVLGAESAAHWRPLVVITDEAMMSFCPNGRLRAPPPLRCNLHRPRRLYLGQRRLRSY
eukprot:5378551-Amphidinium_carterae.1